MKISRRLGQLSIDNRFFSTTLLPHFKKWGINQSKNITDENLYVRSLDLGPLISIVWWTDKPNLFALPTSKRPDGYKGSLAGKDNND